jgi:heterodisulfide reductase subunit A-like polyferredoxin
VETHPNIEILFNSTVKDTSGFIGNFSTIIETPEGERQLDHGVTIMATGGQAYQPEEYLYGQNPKVMTSFEFDKLVAAKDAKVMGANQAVFIQCVGSREPQRPYCSRLCCTHSVEGAIELKRLKPEMDVFILYRDLRTYGEKELLYKEARELGVVFIRFDLNSKPQVEQSADGTLQLTITDPILDRPVVLKPDLLTLASAVLPNPVEDIGEIFLSPNAEGFLTRPMPLRRICPPTVSFWRAWPIIPSPSMSPLPRPRRPRAGLPLSWPKTWWKWAASWPWLIRTNAPCALPACAPAPLTCRSSTTLSMRPTLIRPSARAAAYAPRSARPRPSP